jgi:hypothetical protein
MGRKDDGSTPTEAHNAGRDGCTSTNDTGLAVGMHMLAARTDLCTGAEIEAPGPVRRLENARRVPACSASCSTHQTWKA